MASDLAAATRWRPPPSWTRLTTLDAHTGGEPLRIITGGLPPLPGTTILERRRHLREHLDHVRRALMWEPRGHADMYGCVITPPVTPGADLGVLFMHNEGYSTMCGHGIIALATAAVDTGMVPVREPETTLRIDTPAGLVTAHVRVAGGRADGVRFRNVPSFVLHRDRTVTVPGVGAVRYDVAFGGAFYAFVDAPALGLALTGDEFRRLIELGMAIKHAVMADAPIVHPFEPDLSFLYGTIFTGPGRSAGTDSRNVCIFAEGEVDRSPTGTGVSARMALHHARGELPVGGSMVIESIVDSRFTARVAEVTTFGPHPAVIPEVEGRAHLSGRGEFWIDPADPLGGGFLLR